MDARSLLARLRNTENAYLAALNSGNESAALKASYDAAINALRGHLTSINATEALAALDAYLSTDPKQHAVIAASDRLLDAVNRV